MRQIPTQHRRLHPGQGVQPEEPQDDTQAGPTDERNTPVWPDAQEGPTNGAPD